MRQRQTLMKAHTKEIAEGISVALCNTIAKEVDLKKIKKKIRKVAKKLAKKVVKIQSDDSKKKAKLERNAFKKNETVLKKVVTNSISKLQTPKSTPEKRAVSNPRTVNSKTLTKKPVSPIEAFTA